MAKSYKSKIIAFEGFPGSNKTRLVKHVEASLLKKGYSVFSTDCAHLLSDLYATFPNHSTLRKIPIDMIYIFLFNKFILNQVYKEYDYILLENYYFFFHAKLNLIDSSEESSKYLESLIKPPNTTVFLDKPIVECLNNLRKKRSINFWETDLCNTNTESDLANNLRKYYRGDIETEIISNEFINYQQEIKKQYEKFADSNNVICVNDFENDVESVIKTVLSGF